MSAASMKFGLSYTIVGHKADVRAISATSSGSLITGSRDCTAKLWESNKLDRGYECSLTYEDHNNFVCAVCVVRNGCDNEFIVTGSNDTVIRVFEVSGSQPLLLLIAHSDTVCSLAAGILPGTLVSGSWDKSAALWNMFDNSKEPVAVMKGHEATVWAVLQMPSGVIVTGSADKTLKLWEPTGTLIQTLSGHFDCVRDLTAYSSTKVLSCSNDASVKMWDIEKCTCVGTYFGHLNYIYSIALLSENEKLFITCGEDACLKIWNNDGCIQTINLPCQSAWCTTCLPNGDIAVGLSDGTVRIFTRTDERVAPSDEIVAYESELASKAASTKIGKIDKNKIPGLEALATPGTQDGQTKLIKKGESVWCYKWSSAQDNWEKMGLVVGADNGNGKELYCGQEYDYVFNIDVEDGKPPLKLPYNIGEDPWAIAQKFIHEHNLSQNYLEPVAKFIINNAEEGEHRAPIIASDPFTGDGRYIPSFVGESSIRNSSRDQLNYVAGDMEKQSSVRQGVTDSGFFPQLTCVPFNVYNKSVIEEKLFSYNNQLGDHKLDDELIDQALMLLDENLTDETQIDTVIKLMRWPEEFLVPALDLVRVAVRSKEMFQKMFSTRGGQEIINVIETCMDPESTEVLRVLALRTICNIMTHEEGRNLFLKRKDEIVATVLRYKKPFSRHVQMVVTTTLLNLSVAANHERDAAALSTVTMATQHILPHIKDTEASFRALVTLGTCVWDFEGKTWEEPLLLITTNKDVMDILKQMAAGGGGAPSSVSDEKLKSLEKQYACAEQLLHKLALITKGQ